MTTTTKPEPRLDDCTMNQWPPLAHIADKPQGTVKEGDRALCGAKLMGINLPNAREVCGKCIEIAERRGL